MNLTAAWHYIGWTTAGFCLIGIPLLLKGSALLIALADRLTFAWRTHRIAADIRKRGVKR